jgi:hypothetical protein
MRTDDRAMSNDATLTPPASPKINAHEGEDSGIDSSAEMELFDKEMKEVPLPANGNADVEMVAAGPSKPSAAQESPAKRGGSRSMAGLMAQGGRQNRFNDKSFGGGGSLRGEGGKGGQVDKIVDTGRFHLGFAGEMLSFEGRQTTGKVCKLLYL